MAKEKAKKVGKVNKVTFGKVLIYIFLSIWAFTTIFPFVWVVNNSFKAPNKIMKYAFLPCWSDTLNYSLANNEKLTDENTVDPAVSFDKHNVEYMSPTIRNFKRAFNLGTTEKTRVSVFRAYGYSILISGSVTICVVLFAGMAAFALVRYNFVGRGFLKMIVTASLMFPSFSTIVPILRMMTSFNLINNPLAVILPQIAGNLSFAILILMGYISGLPVDLEEAAFLEGCNVFQIFFKVIVPISIPSFSTVAIFTFLWSYNDLFFNKILITDRLKQPICALLEYISSQWGGTDYGLMCAVITLVVIPVIIVYMLLQKNIIKGLTAGAIKG